MNRWLILAEGESGGRFDPLDQVRPSFLLRDGAWTVAERWIELLQPTVVIAVARPLLKDVLAESTGWTVNDLPKTDQPEDLWLVSGVVHPTTDPRWDDLTFPAEFSFASGSSHVMRASSSRASKAVSALRDWITSGADAPFAAGEPTPGFTLPVRGSDGLWHLVEHLREQLEFDWHLWQRRLTGSRPPRPASHAATMPGASVVNPEQIWWGNEVQVSPQIVLDASTGPIWLCDGVRIEPFTDLRGPAFVGPHTTLLGGRFSGGCALGPGCRIAGEWEASIAQGFANKAHAGFFGHGILGEWVNLGALTTNSDLKNTYGTVRVEVGGRRVQTGLVKVGSFLSDHTKTGIGTLVPTGATWGVGVNIFGGGMGPLSLPPFVWGGSDRYSEHDLERMLATAGITICRRADICRRLELPQEMTPAQAALLRAVFDLTRPVRREFLARR